MMVHEGIRENYVCAVKSAVPRQIHLRVREEITILRQRAHRHTSQLKGTVIIGRRLE
jgi:hypothetical protein